MKQSNAYVSRRVKEVLGVKLFLIVLMALIGCQDVAKEVAKKKSNLSEFNFQDVKLEPEKYLGKRVRWTMYGPLLQVDRFDNSIAQLSASINKPIQSYLKLAEKLLVASGYYIDHEIGTKPGLVYIVDNNEGARNFLKERQKTETNFIIEGIIVWVGPDSIWVDASQKSAEGMRKTDGS